MSSLSRYVKDGLAAHLFRGFAFPSPKNVYVGLYTKAPTEDGGGVEVAGNNYARMRVPFSEDLKNAAAVEFPMALDAWGRVTHFGIFDATTDGHMIGFGPLDPAVEIGRGVIYIFDPGSIEVGYEVRD